MGLILLRIAAVSIAAVIVLAALAGNFLNQTEKEIENENKIK